MHTRRGFLGIASGTVLSALSSRNRQVSGSEISINGRVTNGRNLAVEGAQISVYGHTSTTSPSPPTLLATSISDSDGRFQATFVSTDPFRVVATMSDSESVWFSQVEYPLSAVPDTIELQLNRQLLFGPSVATNNNWREWGVVSCWRWINPVDRAVQVFYLELVEVADDATERWKLHESSLGLDNGLFSLRLFESISVGYEPNSVPTPEGTLGHVAIQRSNDRPTIAEWYPGLGPPIPAFEGASNSGFQQFTEEERSRDYTDAFLSTLSLLFSGSTIIGIILDVLGFLSSISGGSDDTIDAGHLAYDHSTPDFNRQDVVSQAWVAKSRYETPAAIVAQIPVVVDSAALAEQIDIVAETRWKAWDGTSARFSKQLTIDRLPAAPESPTGFTPSLANELRVEGVEGTPAFYSFSVSGQFEGSPDVDYVGSAHPDSMRDTEITGYVQGGDTDRYYFSGDITGYQINGPLTVLLNETEVDPITQWGHLSWNTLVIDGTDVDGETVYDFTVDGEVQKEESLGSIQSGDTISTDGTVQGSIHGGKDGYLFKGQITDFLRDGSAAVVLNGAVIDPGQRWGVEFPHSLVIDGEGTGVTNKYRFVVDGDIVKSEALGSIQSGDVINADGSVEGSVGAGRDGYRFSGEITEFLLDGSATVLLDGQPIDPEARWGTTHPHSLVIEGVGGGSKQYKFVVDGDIIKSEALGSIQSNDNIHSDGTVEGEVVRGKDGYRFAGSIGEFTILNSDFDGELRTIFDGTEVAPDQLSAVTQDPDPLAIIRDVPATATVGEPFTSTFEVKNGGGRAGNWSTITFSFPSFTEAGDETQISINEDFNEYTGIVSAGTTIKDSQGNDITAAYALAEAGTDDDSTWSAGSAHSMSVDVTPNQTGTFIVDLRATLTDDADVSEKFTLPGSSFNTDQQGYAVFRHEVDVVE